MNWLLAGMPILLPAAGLATGRLRPIGAGVLGLVLALLVALAGGVPAGELSLGIARGLWLAVHAVAIILAGAAFHHLLEAWPARAAADQSDEGVVHTQVFAACFLIGPLIESATGFGIGLIVTLSLLQARGLGGAATAALALLSQLLIPWGSLAISTLVAADLAAVGVDALGRATALVSAAMLLAVLPAFWALCTHAFAKPSLRQRLRDAGSAAALGAVLYAANRFIAVEAAVLVATGTLLTVRAAVDAVRRGRRPDLLGALPYLLLIGVMLSTRLIPQLRAPLTEFAAVDPLGTGPTFALLHHPASWLLLVTVACAALRYRYVEPGRVARRALATAWRPAIATMLFLTLGRVLVVAEIPTQLLAPWVDIAGDFAPLLTPLIAAVAGALTTSNLAANGMAMPLQAALAEAGRGGLLTLAAVQNAVGAAFTAFSPARIALAASLLDIDGHERKIYRTAAGIAGGILVVGFMAVLVDR